MSSGIVYVFCMSYDGLCTIYARAIRLIHELSMSYKDADTSCTKAVCPTIVSSYDAVSTVIYGL